MGEDRDESATEVDGPPRRLATADPTRVERGHVSEPADTVVDAPARKPRKTTPPTAPPSQGPSSQTPATTLVTAADAMRDEEVHRTRLFIKVGWLASLGGLGTIPFVDSGREVTIAFVAALVLGMLVSFGYHQAFRDPRRFTPRAMFVLGVMSTFNTHVAILFFGAFTLAPLLIVIGLHFIGRSELAVRRAVYVTAAVCHGTIALALIGGLFDDPGVFATARPLGSLAYVIGAVYVQAAYGLAYATGQIQRKISLRSIEQLQRATRVASQRAALLEELRADLARAQQAGAGRHTGETIGGFRLGVIIGRGAHGEVYDAVREADGMPAAVKLLHREHLADPTTIARFVREVEATAALDAPNIVRVLSASPPDAALAFLAMERLSGLTLAELLRRTPVLTNADVVSLVGQVGAAIDAARGAGIVHRDLKPQNLLISDGVWKVLDFGVAALGDHAGTLTRGGIVGTPQYMAPEQARGERVDHRADLYALGAIAYRALTGRNAFSGTDTPALLYAVVHSMPVAPSTLVEVPDDVDRWIAVALAKQPSDRWSSGAELAAQLVRGLQGDLAADTRAAADQLVHAHPWKEAG